MTETPTPPVIFAQGYGVTWEVENGGPDIETNLSDRLPFDEEEPDYFNTKFKWDSVELKYSAIGEDYEPLGRFKVKAKVFAYTDTKDDTGTESRQIQYIDYTLVSLTITSDDPNSGGTWIYPDDYPEQQEDENHPKQYGGVIMKNDTNKRRMRTEFSVCGLDGGDSGNGIVKWVSTNRKIMEAISAYNYIDVFDDTEFSFIPMNSNDPVDLRDNEKFRFTPLYPDVKDENGKHAPIYPMNTVTTFRPDGRDSVTVTYTAKFSAMNTNTGIEIPLDNPVATIKQTCVQDVSDYAKQMENLFQYCNWNNPQQIDQEDFAPDYPIMYPYTNINGFEGLRTGQTPRTRGDDTDNSELERGDIWYNPNTNERKYYNISDVPESLEVTEGGHGYKDRKGVMCVWLPPQERCYKITEQSNIPFGLVCDIKTKDGEVVSATIADTGTPSGWADGDIVAVTGGKNDARLRISIKEEPGWIDNYVEVF